MRRYRVFAAAAAALLLVGCGRITRLDAPSRPTERTTAQTTVPAPAETAAPTLPAVVTETQPVPTLPPATEPPSEAEPSAGTTAPAVPAPSAGTAAPSPEVDLSISMPAANGRMEVSLDPANAFIAAVAAGGVDPSLLAAVYTVPQNGQNYVFEFSGAERTARTLRRVYLLDESAAVRSVAAADQAERVNISAAENWFCMNVLIRGVVFPAVEARLNGEEALP